MALTPIAKVHLDHVVTFDDDLIFTFQLVPISGLRYQEIIDQHRDDEGKASNEAVAADLMHAGIGTAYHHIGVV